MVTFVETKVKEESEHNIKTHATKEGISLLKIEMKDTKSDIVKWMFIFWVGSISVITGILFAMLHSFIK